MLASELIKELEEKIKKHGDLSVSARLNEEYDSLIGASDDSWSISYSRKYPDNEIVILITHY